MGKKLSEPDAEQYARTDEILHYVWDPVGIGGRIGARDEYYKYLPTVFALLKRGADTAEIEQLLARIAEHRMGLSDTGSRAAHAAALLVDWRSCIDEFNPTFQRTVLPPLN